MLRHQALLSTIWFLVRKICLAAVTGVTPLRDGTTVLNTQVYLLHRLTQFRDFGLLYNRILALTKNTLTAVVAATVLSKFCFKLGPDSSLFTIECKLFGISSTRKIQSK
jgi:hypothetical protein